MQNAESFVEVTMMTALEQSLPEASNNVGLGIQVQNNQFRLDDPLEDSSKLVRELFGPEVGRCHGDFSCSHNRIPGRLYATSNAILYYTSFLGFERRTYMNYQDIVEMELFRTTSIRISTAEGEQYVFKSFENRKEVLRLLRSLEMIATTSLMHEIVPQRQQSDERNESREDPLDLNVRSLPVSPFSTKSTISYKSPSLARPILGNRRRSVSDSVMSSPHLFVTSSTSVEGRSDLQIPATEDGPIIPIIPPLEKQGALSWDQVKVESPLQERATEVRQIIHCIPYCCNLTIALTDPSLVFLASCSSLFVGQVLPNLSG